MRIDFIFREILAKILYSKIPDQYITISDSMKNNLIDIYHVKVNIDIICNTVDYFNEDKYLIDNLRIKNSISKNCKLIGLIGIISFAVKGHGWLLQLVQNYKSEIKNIKIRYYW